MDLFQEGLILFYFIIQKQMMFQESGMVFWGYNDNVSFVFFMIMSIRINRSENDSFYYYIQCIFNDF